MWWHSLYLILFFRDGLILTLVCHWVVPLLSMFRPFLAGPAFRPLIRLLWPSSLSVLRGWVNHQPFRRKLWRWFSTIILASVPTIWTSLALSFLLKMELRTNGSNVLTELLHRLSSMLIVIINSYFFDINPPNTEKILSDALSSSQLILIQTTAIFTLNQMHWLLVKSRV